MYTKIKLKDKVRDHDHITGFYRSCAGNTCNINFNYKNVKIPVTHKGSKP
jgi:hypothetical protein